MKTNNIWMTTTAKRLYFHFCFQFPVSSFHFQFPFPVSISFLFPAFPYSRQEQYQEKELSLTVQLWCSRDILLLLQKLTSGELKASSSLHFCLTKFFRVWILCSACSNLTQEIQFLEFMDEYGAWFHTESLGIPPPQEILKLIIVVPSILAI